MLPMKSKANFAVFVLVLITLFGTVACAERESVVLYKECPDKVFDSKTMAYLEFPEKIGASVSRVCVLLEGSVEANISFVGAEEVPEELEEMMMILTDDIPGETVDSNSYELQLDFEGNNREKVAKLTELATTDDPAALILALYSGEAVTLAYFVGPVESGAVIGLDDVTYNYLAEEFNK